MASLRDLQAGFAAALRVDAPAAAAADNDAAQRAFVPAIVGGTFEPRERLQVYRNNSRAMFDGALERTYPVLQRRVGEDYFRQLSHEYRARHPSRSGDLHWVGRHFPEFLAEHLKGSGYEWLEQLATLEWACECALVAAGEPAVGVEVLAGLGADALASTCLRLQPSLHCISASVPVLDVWQANQPGGDGRPVDLARGGQSVLVSCGDAGLELREVGAPTLEFVRQLQAGAPLAAALGHSGLPEHAVAGALALLFEAGLVTGARPSAPGD